MALLNPGDKVLGFSLDQGGHLSHGHPLNFSGKLYSIIPYFVKKDTEIIDMDEVEAIAMREKPKMILAGFSAYSRSLDWKRFREIADKARRVPVRGHRAYRRTYRGQTIGKSDTVLRRGVHHHAQNVAWAARCHDHVQGKIRVGDR